MNDTIAERFRFALEAAGKTQNGLARELKISQGTISSILRGNTKEPRKLLPLAKGLGVRPEWLLSGEEPMAHGGSSEPDNVEPGPRRLGKVPLLSWVQAGEFVNAPTVRDLGDDVEWVSTTVQVKEKTFALRVMGDSMEPVFRVGMAVVVEPEMDPMPGDYVVARNGDGVTLKKLVQDGADWYLKPENKEYPMKPLGDAKVIGIVREAVTKFR